MDSTPGTIELQQPNASDISKSNLESYTNPTRSMPHDDDPVFTSATSQASSASMQNDTSSLAPRLQTNGSNVSQITEYTDSISPTTSAAEEPYTQYVTSKPDIARVRTPEEATPHSDSSESYAVTSPMSVTSPISTNGTKRTASGHVKSAPSLPNTPLTTTFSGRHSRTDSVSSTGSRAGELAHSLKTRLGYAMAKVQHGWEHKNINEVEHLASHKISPNRHSMSHLDYLRRPETSGLSNGTHRMSMYDTYGQTVQRDTFYHPSKRHSGSFTSLLPSSQPVLGTTPRLQPAPDIRPSTSQRHYHTAPSSQTNTNMMSPPRTPVNGQPRRPPTIRTDTQTAEAERDALQALFQLGSPHATQVPRHQNMSQASSSSQASPLRSEFATPRRVTFARSESDSSARRLSSDDNIAETKDRAIAAQS